MSAGPSRPNVLLMIAHDMGTHLGCYGERTVQTPVIDGIAREGVRFENNFCTAPYCSPSRGAILTGKYPHTNGLMGLVNLGWDLPPSNRILGQVLSSAGYETFLFGLQHEIADPARLATCFNHISDRSLPHDCELVAALASSFLEHRSRQTDSPFYARVGFFEVHRPYERYDADSPDSVIVPPYIQDTPGARQDFAMFHGAIHTMDLAVGQILLTLDQAGLGDDTIVVFTTDHGIDFPRAKGTLYDPGLHTSLIVRWPRGLPTGLVVRDLISSVDAFPSLLDMLGIPAPPDVQGRSFLGLLTDGAYQPNDQIFAEMNTVLGDIKRCVRTERYKYIRNYYRGPRLCMGTCTETSLTRRDMGDVHLAPRPPVELYDLETDPLEIENLASTEDTQETERELALRLDAFLEATDDPVLRGQIARPAGEADIFRRLWSTLPGQTNHPMREIDSYLCSLEDARY